MGSDRVRVSYDPKQQYRSVVMQQGRVTLEADFNEELAIAGEELREETLDIVGPSGTPDNGYLITPLSSTPPFDFSVRPGTMYVGGLRVTTPPPVPIPAGQTASETVGLRYTAQTDWLDSSDDPDWVDTSKNPPANEFVYLLLREQEVSAVEDSDLKDVALGGPDTAQRTRLIQHIVRLISDGQACATGLLAARNKWRSEGLGFNARTMRLVSAATLKVSLSTSGSPPDPCNPQAQGGYLGADNQLIRVQISGVDQATGNLKFVWGFDDASFLYRLDLDKNNKQLLHLQSRPVDASHNPRAKQAVEALRSAAELSNGEYVASLSGLVFTLDHDYDPDTQKITLPATLTQLPDVYYDSTQTPRVFLRVWEEEHVFTQDQSVDLGNTGLQVTFEAGREVFHIGDYWLFAVRPSTPQQVYPERYLADFQPPEGPRMWACPLGVIGWNQQGNQQVGTLLADCRQSFSSLVDLVTVEHEGKLVGVRNTLNFTGPGVTAVTDNPAAKRVDIQITGGGSGESGESSPTLLLFPYCKVTFLSFSPHPPTSTDTLIAISSTTASPFGPPQPAGPVTLYCFGANLPSSPLVIPPTTVLGQPTLSPGQITTFKLSDMLLDSKGVPVTREATFEGYVIADCGFAGAYGFAEVSRSNQGPQQNLILTDSYLAIVLPRRVQPTISTLTPAAQTVAVGGSASFAVTLTANASTNTDVQISLSAPGIANLPSTATVPAGSATTTFTASGISPGTVTITVALAGVAGSATATLTVQTIQVLSITAPKAMADGDSATGTVTLNGPAPMNGATVILKSNNANFLQVDPQVVVPQGSTISPAFNISATNSGTKSVRASITAEFPPGIRVVHVIIIAGQPGG